MKILKELIPYIVIIITVILIRSFLVTPIKVDGDSMYDTLKDGELMILNKIDKTLNGIDRYDIVVFNYEGEKLIKRVIGLPGEIISCENGKIYINGKSLGDKYGSNETSDFKQMKIPKGEYYVLGDNRNISKDSRYIGTIKDKDIKGTTSLIIFPFTHIKSVD